MDPMITASKLQSMPNIRHGFFTRKGGVSKGIYNSLNCGFGSKDAAADVEANRSLIAESLGVAPQNLLTPFQKHTASAVIATKAWPRADAPTADAIVTQCPGLAIGILTADCAPVLFADPDAGVVAAAHAGWRGAKGGILAATVAQMENLGAKPETIIAVIGPALSEASYEVGLDFKDSFLAQDPNNQRFFSGIPPRKPHFNLPAYVRAKLKELGVTAVEDIAACTYTRESLFYSYRRSVHNNEGDYGRQVSAILLK